VPLFQRIFSDQLTPVSAYRALVQQNDIQSPSFLLESVVNGDQQGRYSFVGASPALEVVAKGHKVTLLDHQAGTRKVSEEADPMEVPVQLSRCAANLNFGLGGYATTHVAGADVHEQICT
jgi:anthranilate synthase component 1